MVQIEFHKFTAGERPISEFDAIVIANFGAAVAVQDAQGKVYRAIALRKIPHLVAGDSVTCESVGTVSGTNPSPSVLPGSRDTKDKHTVSESDYRIIALHERRNVLERPDRRHQLKAIAANLTQLVIVAAIEPEIDTLLIDQFCVIAEHANIDAVIVLNKSDLMQGQTHRELEEKISVYANIGYKTALINTRESGAIEPLISLLTNNTSVLVGQSGVGKSSIVKYLLPDLEVRIGAISAATGIGSHTTTVTFRYELPDNTVLIDSPGVRHFSVDHLDRQQLSVGFREIFAASARCRFSDCRHEREPQCHVLTCVGNGSIARQRYENYVRLMHAN